MSSTPTASSNQSQLSASVEVPQSTKQSDISPLNLDLHSPGSSPSSNTSSGSSSSPGPTTISYISAETAAALDDELMSHPPEGCGYTLPQLMELAGLACAQALFESYPPDVYPSALVACGPGNQGGDGLVAARHLKLWGYDVAVWYPKPSQKEFLQSLVHQLEAFDIPVLPEDDFEDALETADVMLDAIFGFSFKGPPREPFLKALDLLASVSRFEFEARKLRPPIVSVDVPSSWDVNEGNNLNAFTPEVLISLSAPKKGVKDFKGTHYIGGRFIPSSLDSKFGLGIPRYQGSSQIVNVTGWNETKEQDKKVEAPMTAAAKGEAQEARDSLLMKKLNIKGESGMSDREKEILKGLQDVDTPTGDE